MSNAARMAPKMTRSVPIKRLRDIVLDCSCPLIKLLIVDERFALAAFFLLFKQLGTQSAHSPRLFSCRGSQSPIAVFTLHLFLQLLPRRKGQRGSCSGCTWTGSGTVNPQEDWSTWRHLHSLHGGYPKDLNLRLVHPLDFGWVRSPTADARTHFCACPIHPLIAFECFAVLLHLWWYFLKEISRFPHEHFENCY